MKTTRFKFQYHVPEETLEDDYEDGIVYVWEKLKVIALKCPCGCRVTILLNINPDVRPRWSASGNTIKPSIRRIVGCKSHFSITNGIIK